MFLNIVRLFISWQKHCFYTIVIRNNISRSRICNNCTRLNRYNQSDARAVNSRSNIAYKIYKSNMAMIFNLIHSHRWHVDWRENPSIYSRILSNFNLNIFIFWKDYFFKKEISRLKFKKIIFLKSFEIIKESQFKEHCAFPFCDEARPEEFLMRLDKRHLSLNCKEIHLFSGSQVGWNPPPG